MAADIVMCNNLLSVLALEEIALLFRSTEQHQKLKESVAQVKGALLALEVGQRMEDSEAVRRLGNLVTLFHQADDLFDVSLTCLNRKMIVRDMESRDSWRALQRVVNAFTQDVSHFFSPSNQLASPLAMAPQVNKISQEVELVMEKLKGSRLPSSDHPDRQFEPPELTLAETTVLGRDEDKKKIIEMLLHPSTRNKSNVSVISIVGLPGLGKSTLAQFVYDDEKVKNHFDLRMWVRASHIYDEREIIREIVESCTSRNSNYRGNSRPANLQYSRAQPNEMAFPDFLGCRSSARSTISSSHYTSTGNSDVDIFERRLRKEIDGKLFLLILDYACIKHWLPLKNLLARGARGSHILVTTSSVEVADLAKTETVDVYHLKGLAPRASFSLFEKLAFGQGDARDRERKKIAKSIVNICQGVPLTIKVAGSLLYGKSTDKWRSFKNDLMLRESNIMDYILQLSYSDLPVHLKACFSYCSLFPEDFDFNKHDLISLWIAQGYVNPLQDRSLVEAAEMYFLELSRRCFFQDVRTDDLGNVVTCKMHPTIRNLACQNAAGVVNMYMADLRVNNFLNSSCKHVSLNYDRDSSMVIPPDLTQAQFLRTLVSVRESECNTKVCGLPCNLLISHFKCLRVLDLHDLGIEELPSSIGKLIQLRYLDVSKNDSLVTLPKSVTKLYKLQTLKLNSCLNLRRLPNNFGELVNLQNLEVDECDSLICMPPGLEKLTQLETLSRFVVGRNSSKDMPEVGLKALKELKNLRGRLEIELTGDWMTNIHEAKEAKLQSKSHLTELKINWPQPISDVEKSSYLLSEEDKKSYQDLLEYLKPYSNLKILCIEGYKGEDFPSWARVDMLATSLPNLVVVSIEGCDKCRHLPPFGKLPFLKRLTLRHMANVKYVEGETQESSANDCQAVATSSPFFQSLEELTLHNFYKLKGWRQEVMQTSRHQAAIRYFPRLSKLRIWNCPKLSSMPLFTRVVDLDLRNVNQKLLEESEKKASTQAVNDSFTKHLQIRRCANLESFTAVRKGLGGLPSLKDLVVERCDALTSLASELQYFTSLERLEISSCKELDLSDDTRRNSRNSTNTSWISLGAFNNLTLRGIPNPWMSLENLFHLSLREIPKMEALPEGLKHVQTLKILWISACNALRTLPEWIGSLMALQHLRIESCPSLTRLPDGIKEVRSLMKVEITECPELMERCREHTGEDWPKIKHARILLHKSWRYGFVSEPKPTQNRSNVRMLADVKYFIIPVVTASIE